MERREEEGGGWTGRRHSGEHAQQPHSSPQLGLCAAFLPILLLRELLYNSSEYLRIPRPPALLLLVVRPSAWESGREGRPAIFERIFPAASLPSSPPHAGRPRRRGIYRGGSSSPHYRIRRGGDTIHTGIRTRARAGLPLQIALSRFQHDHDSIGRAGNGLAHFANTRTCTRRFTLGLGARSRSQLLDGGRGSRAGLWGPCKAATEHEAAGAGGRGLARALGRLLPR